jgi:serine/threonine protein kinase
MNGVLHRDFKLDNILLDESLTTVKICDFGVSKLVKKGEIINDQCGTPAYLAPEIAADLGYEGFTVDIWSLGVLLYAMICGTVPFKAPTMKDLHKLILKGKYFLPDHVSVEARDLINGMLQLVPKNRFSIKEILTHPWFKVKGRDEDLNLPPKFVGKPETDISRHVLLEAKVSINKAILE